MQLFSKALREMKLRKVVLRYPSHVPTKDWRIFCVADAGWATRGGGYALGLSNTRILTPLDAIETFQALFAETICQQCPREFRNSIPKEPASLVIGEECFYDALTRPEPKHPALFLVDNQHMVLDALSKLRGDTKLLFQVPETGK